MKKIITFVIIVVLISATATTGYAHAHEHHDPDEHGHEYHENDHCDIDNCDCEDCDHDDCNRNECNSHVVTAPTRKEQLWWIINAARGNGEFTYEFELAPNAAQIEAGTHGQRGIVEGKDGVIRVFNLNDDGTYTEATNSVANALFARNYRFLTQKSHNHNSGDITEFPDFFGELTGESWSFENFPLITENTLNNSADIYDRNLEPSDLEPENFMLFVFDHGSTGELRGVHFTDHNGNSVFKRISQLQPRAVLGIPHNSGARTTKTQLWWLIDAARGNGEFSFMYELEDGTTGVVICTDGVIITTPSSPEMGAFVENLPLLTQRSHNHNNEVDGVRPFAPPFPEWLSLTNNGEEFTNGNFELFPLVSQETLDNARNRFEINLQPVYPSAEKPEDAMLFIYDNGVMSAAYWNGVYIKISDLKNDANADISIQNPELIPPDSVIAAPNLNTAAEWARESIQNSYSLGIIPTDLQNNYADVITRAEFCRLAVQWLEYATGKNIEQIVADFGIPERMGYGDTFSDTNDPIILAAYRIGITSGVTAPTSNIPGVFNPHGQFERQQAAVMLTNIYRLIGVYDDNEPTADFVDLNTAANWAYSGINFVYANGIMRGTGDRIFNPLGTFTRQESIITFNNMSNMRIASISSGNLAISNLERR